MMLNDLRVWRFAFQRVRYHLPKRVRVKIENGLYRRTLTASQLKSLHVLGDNIGLDRKEIYAALPNHSQLSQLGEGRRMTLFSLLVTIVIIIVASVIVLVATGTYPAGAPNTTYVPGTRYGSISPRDFSTSD